MSVELPGILLFVLCLLFAPFIGGVAAIGIALPFEATAILSIGGVALNATDAYIATLIWISMLKILVKKNRTIVIRHLGLPIIICIHGFLAALVLPFMFSGSVDVALVSGGDEGVRVGRGFGLTITPLKFTNSNLSQLFYLFFQMGTFAFFISRARKEGGKILLHLVLTATIVNLLMVSSELVGLKSIQEWFFTADYRNLQNASVMGVDRVVGGFREAARQGQFSAACLALWLGYYIKHGRVLHLSLATACLVAAVLSMSSTAIIGVAVAIIACAAAAWGGNELRRSLLLISLAAVLIVFGWTMIGEGGRNLVINGFAGLILDKGESASGLERVALAEIGFRAFVDTVFLGAGLGSTRANGLFFVWLSNLGLLGVLFLGVLIYRIYSPKRFNNEREELLRFPALAAFTVILVAALVSLTMPNLGQLFVVFGALGMAAGEGRGFSASSPPQSFQKAINRV